MTGELESYKKRCLELEKKSENDEKRCLMLEVEVEDLKTKNKVLEGKIMKIREVVEVSDGEDEVEKFYDLMTEMKVLECEKQKAESEVYKLKEKVSELMTHVYELESGMNEKAKEDVNVVSRFSSKVKRRLPFEDDGCSSKKMAPSTPGVAQNPFSVVIDISDEDVNNDETPENKNISDLSNTASFNKTNLEDFDEEDLDDLKFRCSNSKSAKRKRAANIIPSDDETSDNETTYDDNALIRTLMKPLSSRPKINSEDEVTEGASKRYLTRLRTLGSKNKQDTSGVNQNKTVSIDGNSSSEDEDDYDDVEGSESEEESLSDFINDSPEIVSESESASESSNSIEEPENVLNDYKETIDSIRRKKVSNFKWDLQGEMQADFGKDPELCMRAVCALYRQQTEDEKASKVTIHHNERGFSQPDADRGSKVAEFLMDGEGDLKKTVEELEMYDSKGIELCRCLMVKTEVEYVKKNNKELETDRTLSGTDETGDEFSKVRKRLPFEDDGCFSKKMAISTPGVVQTPFSGVIDISDEHVNYDETPEYKNISDSSNHAAFNKTQTPFSGVIDISDEDVNYDETPEYKKISDSSNHAAFNKINLEDFNEEDLDDLKFRCSNSKSVKRKRAANIIPSDDETSDNETAYVENALFCTLMKPLNSRPKIDSEDEVTEGASKRCLTRLRNLGSKNNQDTSGVNQNKTVVIDVNSSSEDEDDDDDDDVEGLESEEESLSDFINDSPEIVFESESESASESSDNFEEPENVLNDYKETIDNIRRKKVSNFKWNLQGEMQADFGKDPELCMRAVCALYRRQTEDEKASNETIHQNERGFSKPDANNHDQAMRVAIEGTMIFLGSPNASLQLKVVGFEAGYLSAQASDIAQFLTDGDSKGNLNKTVEELESLIFGKSSHEISKSCNGKRFPLTDQLTLVEAAIKAVRFKKSDYLEYKVYQGCRHEVERSKLYGILKVEPHGNVDHVAGSQKVQTQDLIHYHSTHDREQHLAWELFSYREDSNEAAFAVAAVEKIYAHESLTFNNTVACELIFKWKAGLKDDMDSRSDVYLLSNGCKKCSDDNDGYYWEYTPGLLDKAKRNILGMEIVRDQSGNTLRVSQSRFYNGKLGQTLLEGHSILSLEGSLSGDCDVEKNGKWSCIYAVGSQEYRVVCTRLDIASADVAAYMTLTEAAKEAIWLKGLAIESGFELKMVAGIATGALSKAIPSPRFQHWLKLLRIGEG
ncbi:hypothetical protein Tco_0529999 [Tanacetum coccineum]